MGVGRASGHSSSRIEYVYQDRPGNPDPKKFTITAEMKLGNYLMAQVNYPDATNFEGNKIMIYEGIETLSNLRVLDPHFSKDAVSPIIRLEPTIRGWMRGAAIMKLLNEAHI